MIVFATSTRQGVESQLSEDAVRELTDQIDVIKEPSEVKDMIYSTGSNALAALSAYNQERNYQRDCLYGMYGCNKGPSEATQRYWQEQYVKAQMAAQVRLNMQERAREKFYSNQANHVQWIVW